MMGRQASVLIGLAVLAGLWAVSSATGRAAPAVPEAVAAVLKKRCIDCHKGAKPPGGLNLELARVLEVVNAPSKERPALKIIDTADPASSYLLKKILGAPDISGAKMPRRGKMSAEEIDVLKDWVLSLKAKKAS